MNIECLKLKELNILTSKLLNALHNNVLNPFITCDSLHFEHDLQKLLRSLLPGTMIHPDLKITNALSKAKQLFGLEDNRSHNRTQEVIEIRVLASQDLEVHSSRKTIEYGTHKIYISQGVVEKCNERQISFLIGRETAKIVFNYEYMYQLLSFFGDNINTSGILRSRFCLWELYANITLDRCGAVCLDSDLGLYEDLKSIIHNFRLSALSQDIRPLNISDDSELIRKCSELRLELFDIFVCSDYYLDKKYLTDQKIDPDLERKTKDRIDEFHRTISEKERLLIIYAISAGLITANKDGIESVEEIIKIKEWISKYLLVIPDGIIEVFRNKDSIHNIFEISMDKLLEMDASLKRDLLGFLIEIAFSDNELAETERDFLVRIAKEKLGIEGNEFVELLKDIAKKMLIPSTKHLF